MRIRYFHILAAMCLAVVLSVAPAQAQNTFKILAGVNFASWHFDPNWEEISGSDTIKSGTVTGIVAGVQLVRPISEKVSLQVEGLLVGRGGKIVGTDTFGGSTYRSELTDRANALEIAVLARIPVGAVDKFCVNAGLFLSSDVSRSVKGKTTIDGDVEDEDELTGSDRPDIKGTSFGLALGGEVHLTKMIDAGARFNLGLTNIDKEEDTEFNSVKTRSVRVYVVIKLTRK